MDARGAAWAGVAGGPDDAVVRRELRAAVEAHGARAERPAR